MVDVDGVGKEVLALLLTARYRRFPCSSSSLLLHPPPARCLARGLLAPAPNEKSCLMNYFCPARYENSSALKAVRVEKHLCSTDGHGPEPFSKGNSNYIRYWPGFWFLRCNRFPKGRLSFFLQVVDLCWVATKMQHSLGRSEQPAESWCLVQLTKARANGEGAYGGTGEGKMKVRS